jgi:hypothetical protein
MQLEVLTVLADKWYDQFDQAKAGMCQGAVYPAGGGAHAARQGTPGVPWTTAPAAVAPHPPWPSTPTRTAP